MGDPYERSPSVIIGLCSSYKEGPLVQGAVRSLLEACERVAVFEGPAGDPIDAPVPWSDFGGLLDDERLTFREGRWRTDARKRQAMLEWAQGLERPQGSSLWGVIVDADEVLINAPYLRDWLNRLDWHEQVNEEVEYLGRPMRLVEMDGSVSWVRGRLLRLDRVIEYKVSTSVFTARYEGRTETFRGGGNQEDSYLDWELPRREALEAGRMIYPPPFTLEPYLVHRSLLRHPLRSGNRLHQQEAQELAKIGISR